MVIDCDNEKLLKYIYSLLREKGEPQRFSHGTVIYPSIINADPQRALETFENRFNSNQIVSRLSYDKYISNNDLQTVVEGLKLDTDSFFLLALFCYDYALDRSFNATEVAQGINGALHGDNRYSGFIN